MRHIHDVVSEVGTFAYRTARGTSLHDGLMQRVYRDIHSGTQHIHLADQVVQERSEEHTSELQSLMRISYAVFCLKKKIKNHTSTLMTPKTTYSSQIN